MDPIRLAALFLFALATTSAAAKPPAPVGRVTHTDAEWRQLLTPAQYEVLRQAGTERAFTGACWNEHRKGAYLCAACGLELFGSAQKFESGTGWPSFWKPAVESHVVHTRDRSVDLQGVELECARCGGHLGHVFDDGPKPTGLRYCINSVSLRFVPAK
jgi:peptide-methionine (R)-S-oxide reductase